MQFSRTLIFTALNAVLLGGCNSSDDTPANTSATLNIQGYAQAVLS